MIGLTQNLRGRLYKILGSFLHGDTAQKSNDFFFGIMRHLYRHNFGTEWFYGIVHGRNFGRIDTVFFNNRLPGKVTYRNDMVGPNSFRLSQWQKP